MDGNTGGFAGGVESWDDFLVTILVDGEDFAGVFCRDTAHVVVDCWKDGDGFLGDVDAREDGCCFGDTGETFFEDFSGQVR